MALFLKVGPNFGLSPWSNHPTSGPGINLSHHLDHVPPVLFVLGFLGHELEFLTHGRVSRHVTVKGGEV
jgi:hypothetical protein